MSYILDALRSAEQRVEQTRTSAPTPIQWLEDGRVVLNILARTLQDFDQLRGALQTAQEESERLHGILADFQRTRNLAEELRRERDQLCAEVGRLQTDNARIHETREELLRCIRTLTNTSTSRLLTRPSRIVKGEEMNGELVQSLAEPLTVVEVHLHALTRLAEHLEVIRGDIEWSRREVETAKVREGLGTLAAQARSLRQELRQDITSLQAALERTRRGTGVPTDVAQGPPSEPPERNDSNSALEDAYQPGRGSAADLTVWKAVNNAHEKLSILEARLDGWDRRERDAQRLIETLQNTQTATQTTLLEKLQVLTTNLEALGKEFHAFIREGRSNSDQRFQELRATQEETAAKLTRHWRLGLWLLFLLFLMAAAALVRPEIASW